MINQEEYEVLKGLDDKWKWIARDGVKDKLNIYELRPIKSAFVEWWFTNRWCGYRKIMPLDLFQFIQWEDEEPHNIQELIEEYEKYKKASDYFKVNIKNVNQSMLDDLPTESEETEVKKDKDWLSEQIGELNSTDAVFNESGVSYIDTAVSMERVYELINQLDEPEVLSQELPVIPKYVAEWIEKKGESYKSSFLSLGYELYSNNISDSEINIWLTMNQNIFARAWLDGYEVEKEPLYYIPLGVVSSDGNEFYLAKTSLDVIGIDSSSERYVKDKWNAHYYRFTEQEIKDYDERFWAFAVPVEEVEE